MKVKTLLAHILLNISLCIGLKIHPRIESIEDMLCHDLKTGSKLPHPEFCDVFLVCSENRGIQISCANGLLFNPNTEQCDSEYNICPSGALKSGNKIPPNTITTESSDLGEETTDETNTEDATEENETEDPDDVENETTSEPEEETEPTEETEVTKVTELTTHHPTKGNATNATTSGIIICPNVDSEQVIFISHPNECSIYYLCYHGKPIPFQCSIGLHWNNREKTCSPPEIARCEATDADCPKTGIRFLPHPDMCQKFFYCRDGVKTAQQCQPFHYWDVNEKKCKIKSEATCYTQIKKSKFG